jgi:hypothetical protein
MDIILPAQRIIPVHIGARRAVFSTSRRAHRSIARGGVHARACAMHVGSVSSDQRRCTAADQRGMMNETCLETGDGRYPSGSWDTRLLTPGVRERGSGRGGKEVRSGVTLVMTTDVTEPRQIKTSPLLLLWVKNRTRTNPSVRATTTAQLEVAPSRVRCG